MTRNERFWLKIDKSGGTNACWNWIAGRQGAYGVFWNGKRHVYAHRYAFGVIDSPLHVLHNCDNPLCCNPAHLRLGTHADNMHDMFSKGRRVHTAKGEQHGRSKLTREQINDIRSAVATGTRRQLVANLYGISRRHVGNIVNGNSWQ